MTLYCSTQKWTMVQYLSGKLECCPQNRNSSIFLAGGFDSYISQPGCVTERNIVYAHIRQEEYNWHDSRQVGNLSWLACSSLATLTVDISYALCVICNINVLHTCYEWDFFYHQCCLHSLHIAVPGIPFSWQGWPRLAAGFIPILIILKDNVLWRFIMRVAVLGLKIEFFTWSKKTLVTLRTFFGSLRYRNIFVTTTGGFSSKDTKINVQTQLSKPCAPEYIILTPKVTQPAVTVQHTSI